MLGSTIDVLWTARYDYPAGWSLEVHRHSYFQMIYFLGGKGAFQIGDADLPVKPGALALIKPGEAHSGRANSVIKTLDVKFDVQNGSLRAALLKAEGACLLGESRVPELLERIRSEGERRQPLFRDVCRALMTEILLLYLRNQSGCPEKIPSSEEAPETVHDLLLRRGMEYIRQNYAAGIGVADVARALGCCDRSLRAHFQTTLGVCPLEYLQRYRVARAKELIEYSDYSLKEIAVRVGFKNVHHFTRLFAEIEGQPPGTWRQIYKEGIRKDICINPRFSNLNWTRAPEAERGMAPQ
jgi:AraC-like DNA-binding protein